MKDIFVRGKFEDIEVLRKLDCFVSPYGYAQGQDVNPFEYGKIMLPGVNIRLLLSSMDKTEALVDCLQTLMLHIPSLINKLEHGWLKPEKAKDEINNLMGFIRMTLLAHVDEVGDV